MKTPIGTEYRTVYNGGLWFTTGFIYKHNTNQWFNSKSMRKYYGIPLIKRKEPWWRKIYNPVPVGLCVPTFKLYGPSIEDFVFDIEPNLPYGYTLKSIIETATDSVAWLRVVVDLIMMLFKDGFDNNEIDIPRAYFDVIWNDYANMTSSTDDYDISVFRKLIDKNKFKISVTYRPEFVSIVLHGGGNYLVSVDYSIASVSAGISFFCLDHY